MKFVTFYDTSLFVFDVEGMNRVCSSYVSWGFLLFAVCLNDA